MDEVELQVAEGPPPRSASPSSDGECRKYPNSPSVPRNKAPRSYTGTSGGEKVTFLVDGSRVTVDTAMLASQPETMLGKMFGSTCVDGRLTRPNEDGDYTLKGISLDVFRCVLEYYKSSVMYCPPHVSIRDLREACDYLLLPFDDKTVRCNDFCSLLHELSNDGAKKLFEAYLVDLILPVMVQCATQGDRECHIVILCEDDVVEWDAEYPPPTGEEYYEVIRSTKLYRFFKYVENRDVAKDVLRERSLKKIRLGIEGYPTHMEKLRRRPNSERTEVVYNYVQRPFVHCGWEVEEARSRHVDFQCVKPKPGLTPDPEAAYLLAGEPAGGELATDQQEAE